LGDNCTVIYGELVCLLEKEGAERMKKVFNFGSSGVNNWFANRVGTLKAEKPVAI